MKHFNIFYGSVLRFILSTLINFLISYLPYLFLIYIGAHYILAYLVAFILLLISSCIFHIKFSFLSSITIKKIFIYSIYYILYFCLGCLIIWYCVEIIKFSFYLAPLFSIILLPVHYIISKLIIEKY
jgi:hypothetical protein